MYVQYIFYCGVCQRYSMNIVHEHVPIQSRKFGFETTKILNCDCTVVLICLNQYTYSRVFGSDFQKKNRSDGFDRK